MDTHTQLPRKQINAKWASENTLLTVTYDELRQNAMPYKARRRRLNQLSITEIREVFDAVKVDKLTHASAAIKFSVLTNTVGQIVRNFRVKDDYVQELLDRHMSKQTKITAVVHAIQSFKDTNQNIWSL